MKIFLQPLQVRNWMCHTPVMSCYKEALVLRKFSKNSKINFFAQNPFQTILGKLFFFTVIFFSQHLKILAILEKNVTAPTVPTNRKISNFFQGFLGTIHII